MALYEYRCPKGHNATEIRRVDNRRDPLACPKCKQPMELQISAPATPVLNPARAVRPPRTRY